MRRISHQWKWRHLFLIIIGIVIISVWTLRNSMAHPQFGQIYVSRMAMRSSNPPSTVWGQVEETIRGWLDLPKRYGPTSDYGLLIGPTVLGWSCANNIPGERDGYIYMCDVRPSGKNAPLWEFALSDKRRLCDVTLSDIPTQFYRKNGKNDPRGANVFGPAWKGRTILVPEGQVFFARLIDDLSVVYVVHLAKQKGVSNQDWATMKAKYVVAAIHPSIRTGAANPDVPSGL